MEENENKQVFEQKSGLDKNLVVPILVVVILTALAIWFVPSSEEEVDFKKPLPQLDSVVKPLDGDDSALPALDTEDSSLPSLDTGTVIRPLDDIETEVVEDSSESTEIDETSTPAVSQADSQPDSTPATTEDDVRVLISELRKEGADSSQKAYEEAEKRRRIGDNENAYLLYFFAARHGHGDAALALGTMADPAYFTSVSSALPAPDLTQAVKWYKKAIDAGNRDAKKKLSDLTKRIKKQAESGSSEAQRLLLQLL